MTEVTSTSTRPVENVVITMEGLQDRNNLLLDGRKEVTSTSTRPVENVVITTKGLQDRNNLLLDGRTVENKGKLCYKIYKNGQVLSSLFIKLHLTSKTF